jgi:hypothetical protein
MNKSFLIALGRRCCLSEGRTVVFQVCGVDFSVRKQTFSIKIVLEYDAMYIGIQLPVLEEELAGSI